MAALLLAATSLTGCGAEGSSEPVIHSEAPPAQRAELSPAHVGDPIVVSVTTLCRLSPADAVEVEEIDLVGADGIELEDFAVTPGPSTVNGWPSDLDGIQAGHARDVTSVCAGSSTEPDAISTVNVQVTRTSTADASLDGFVVHWTSDGASGELESPMGLTLCDTCAQGG